MANAATTPRGQRARIDVQIAARYRDKVKPAMLHAAAQATLDQRRLKHRVELTIVITGNAQLRSLNRVFRAIDAPTDVLSFATDEQPRPDTIYLGDVVISYTQAREQAQAGGHPVESELQLLVVHGVLHLLGYDHEENKEAEAMEALEIAALAGMGIANPYELRR